MRQIKAKHPHQSDNRLSGIKTKDYKSINSGLVVRDSSILPYLLFTFTVFEDSMIK